MPLDIFRKTIELIDARGPFVAALILRTEGSTPQVAGVRAAIDASGTIWGTLGGGMVEAEAQHRAAAVCQQQRATVFDFHLDHASAASAGAICGGKMRILLDPLAALHRQQYADAATAIEQRRRGVLITTIRERTTTEAAVRWVPEADLASCASILDAKAAEACIEHETARLFVEDRGAESLVEPVVPPPRLIVAGGGHVGQALAGQASLVGFETIVLDDRPEFTNPSDFPPGVTVCCDNVPQRLAAMAIDKATYIVLVTRGHLCDAEALAACIHSPAAYLGMIGSRRKVFMVREKFLESGLATEAQFDRVCAPIGLDIGAVTVPEIATSITAQLIAARRQRKTR